MANPPPAVRRSRERLQRLAAGLLEAQEQERRGAARDFPDEVSQRVVALAPVVEEIPYPSTTQATAWTQSRSRRL
jgi:signal transduction histidine kinase